MVYSAVILFYTNVSQANTNFDFDEDKLKHELTSTPSIVEMRFTAEVNSYLRTYLKTNRSKSQAIVNRMMQYFPLIEKKLEEHGLPQELKYLAIVESALNPTARSRAGALGLWQFMSPTAKEYGIRIYHSVDERMDPYTSTDAALSYLAMLYDRFGDWELALAAYNAGQGRVSRTMDRTNVTNYWDLREHLPRETANYIPAFIAASYIFSDFNKHGFIPERSHPDYHFTSRVEIFNHKVYLKDVARLMHVDLDTLMRINPMYKRNYIPKSPNGYNLILPNRCLKYYYQLQDTLERSDFVKLANLTEHIDFQSFHADSIEDIYLNATYIVQYKENLFSVAKIFDLDILQLKYWNNLPSLHVDHGMMVDLPISLTSGRFLISDYKKVKSVPKLQVKEQSDIYAHHGNCSYHQIADNVCSNARHQYARTIADSENSFTITKGIPVDYQLKSKSNSASLPVTSDASIGFRLSVNQ